VKFAFGLYIITKRELFVCMYVLLLILILLVLVYLSIEVCLRTVRQLSNFIIIHYQLYKGYVQLYTQRNYASAVYSVAAIVYFQFVLYVMLLCT